MSTALPAGFGAAPLTDAQRASDRALLDSLAEQLLNAVVQNRVPQIPQTGAAAAGGAGGAVETFKLHSSKDGLTTSLGTTATSTMIVVKGEVAVPAALDELSNFVMGSTTEVYNTMMHEADAMFVDGRVLHRYEGRGYEFDNTGINVPARLGVGFPTRARYWSGFKLPWPLWSRDFLYQELASYAYLTPDTGAWRVGLEPGTTAGPGERVYAFTVSTAFVSDDCPDLEADLKYVRAQLGLAGYVWWPADSSTAEAPVTNLAYVVLADAKGSLPDWVQNVVAPDQAQNPARIRDLFVQRRKAEALLAGSLPPSITSAPGRGIVCKLATIPRGTVHTRTVPLSPGETLTVWSAVEYKRAAVEVAVEPASAPVTQTLPSGAAFENGSKLDNGVVLTSVIGPAAAPCTVTVTWSNAGLHLSSKVVAFAMEINAGGPAAAAGGK